MEQKKASTGILIRCEGVGKRLVQGENCPDVTLWCDMNEKSSLFFSSIGEDSAMLCLNRSVPLKNGTVEPQERRVPYNKAHSVGENLLQAAYDWMMEASK